MKFNDVVLLGGVLLFGILIGVIATAGMYHSSGDRQSEEQQAEDRKARQEAEEERDQLRAQVNAYQEAERKQQIAFEQPDTDEPEPRPTARQAPLVAAAPRPDTAPAKEREAVPAPREEGTGKAATAKPPTTLLGPPRVPRQPSDNATDTSKKTAP
jgi:hypothetical protein